MSIGWTLPHAAMMGSGARTPSLTCWPAIGTVTWSPRAARPNQNKSNATFDRIALLSAPADMMLARSRHQPHPAASGRGRTTAARDGDRGKILMQIGQ
jgi:hypothetical protein